jgi:hypothetical protein
MTLEEIQNGVTYSYAFRNLTELVCHIQHANSYVQFKDPDGLITTYQVIGFPNLTPEYIESRFAYSLKRPNGEIIPTTKQQEYYQEPDYWPFMLVSGLPIGIWEFGIKQAVNGLTRRLEIFEGDMQSQGGYRLFNEIGEKEQPVVFDIINVQHETLADDGSGNQVGQQDGSFEISVVNGSGGYEYSLDGETYQASAVYPDLSAQEYTVYVRDQAGVVRYQTIRIEQEGDGQL